MWRSGRSKTLRQPCTADEGIEDIRKERPRRKTVLNSLKGKLWKRNRSSTLSESYPVSSKSSTLPVLRRNKESDEEECSLEIPGKGNAPTKAFHQSMEDVCDKGPELIRKDSSDSTDSGVESSPSGVPACYLVENHESNEIILSARYDDKAVDEAFGPMKDISRWYLVSQQREQEALNSRPPCPLPPVRSNSVAVTNGNRVCDPPRVTDERLYDTVSPCVKQSRGLSLGLRDLAQHGWYWGPITRQEAEEKLFGQPDGTFLVRDSSNDRYLLSVSFRSQGRTLHTRVEYGNGNFSFFGFPDAESDSFGSVVELIERSVQYSQNGVFCFSRARTYHSVAIPVRLSIPLSRFKSVQSLQHQCRFVIRQNTRFDLIQELPLPKLLHSYLQQSHY